MTGTLRQRTPLDLWRAALAQRRAHHNKACEATVRDVGTDLGRLLLAGGFIGVMYLLGTLAAWWSF